MDTDEVIRLGELRSWLMALAEMSYQSTGHRRIKNPRIWSLHDPEVLTHLTTAAPTESTSVVGDAPVDETPPEPGLNCVASADGRLLLESTRAG